LAEVAMERKLVTCPETAHLEEVEYEVTQCGMLVLACSRFEPSCELECPRECAARLDRRSHVADELESERAREARVDDKAV
jgi:hypothetical protein